MIIGSGCLYFFDMQLFHTFVTSIFLFNMKVLIVEDEQILQESIHSYLMNEGYKCEAVSTFKEAEEKICLYLYDCILVDINLPDGSGLDLIAPAKQRNSSSGIIIISARETVEDRVRGLKDGADDYIVSHFTFQN